MGKAFLYGDTMGPACFAGYLIRFSFDRERVLPGLIKYWTVTPDYWAQVTEAALQATIENVSAEKYKDLEVPVPEAERRAGILRQLIAADARSSRARELVTGQMRLLAERRQALITAAVTGELSVPVAA